MKVPSILQGHSLTRLLQASASAALILSGVGAWAVLATRAPPAVAALPVVQIDPSKMMMNARRDLPTERFVDYSFVFN